MQLDKAFKDFIAVHRIDNKSPKTIRNYHRYVIPFMEWLKKEHDISDTEALKVTHLRGWISYLQNGGGSKRGGQLKDSTIHLYGTNMLAYCHWLEYEGYIPERITTRFKLPRKEKHFIPTYTPEDIKKMFDACEETWGYTPQIRKALTARNRAILAVFLDSGIRLSELSQLRLRDIDKELRVLVIHRKGNKWQQVPISRDAFKYLHDYLHKHRKHLIEVDGQIGSRKDDPVFISTKGQVFTYAGIQTLFRRLRKKTGIEDKVVGPHNCRRYMATTQLAMGRSPLDVQRQMGHTTLTMTNHYASLTLEQLQKSHEQYSPLRKRETIKNEENSAGYWEE